MLKIEKFVTPSPEQWEIVIEGMRNPMNSWDKMDSSFFDDDGEYCFYLGNNDYNRMLNLSKGGGSHAKYRRMIPVYLTLTAPLYWWKEFDTYKVGTVANSCSTMHKIQAKEFTMEDFSCEHLQSDSLLVVDEIIHTLNVHRKWFIEKALDDPKIDWWQMIQLLPSSYNQKRTVMLNYEVLANIYRDRKNHKLDEWHVFCDWIRELPYSELIIGEE